MSPSDERENLIKIFGMTNHMVEAELDRIEKENNVDLGRRTPRTAEKDEMYYPQFEEAVRQEAAKMADHYEIFYCLEKSIRRLIAETLEEEKGANWWDLCVPESIKRAAQERMQTEIDSGFTPRSEAHIDFTTFGELGEIIKTNWDVFGSIFNSRRAVEKVMTNLNTLRAPIAHCCPLAEDEVLRLQLSLKDWFRLME